MSYVRVSGYISELFEIMGNSGWDDDRKAREVEGLLVRFSDVACDLQRRRCASVLRKYCMDIDLAGMSERIRNCSPPVIRVDRKGDF
jgi:hypothetical protein